MKRILVFVICLILIQNIQATPFSRPWENRTWIAQNPNIWNNMFEVWWNVPDFQKTMDSMNLEQDARLGVPKFVETPLTKAIAEKQLANNDFSTCRLALATPFPLTIAAATINPVVGFIAEFIAISSCLDYRMHWISSVDNTLDALEISINEAEKSIDIANGQYEEVKFAGLCEAQYHLAGSEACSDLTKTFGALDTKISELQYGKYPLLRGYTRSIEIQLTKPVPDLRLVDSSFSLIWTDEGIVAQFNSLGKQAKAAKMAANRQYDTLHQSANERKTRAESEFFNGIEKEKLWQITRAPKSTGLSRGGTVAESYAQMQMNMRDLGDRFANAKAIHLRTDRQGYLAESNTIMNDVNEKYADILPEIRNLEVFATQTLIQQKDEAAVEIELSRRTFNQTTAGSKAKQTLDEAVRTFESANQKSTLGDEFVAYSQAAALARYARNQKSQLQEADTNANLAELKDLLKRAEKDKINVVAEREMMLLIDNSDRLNEPGASLLIRQMIDSIIEKAQLKYDYELLRMRKQLYEKIALAGPDAADLLTDLKGIDKDYFDGFGKIDYIKTIGHINELETQYTKLDKTLEMYLGSIVGNAMALKATPIFGQVWLDRSTTITLDLVLHNPLEYGGTNITVPIQLRGPIPLMYSDIRAGRDQIGSIRTTNDNNNGKTLILNIKKVEPFETKRIVFEKEDVLAHTISRKVIARGIGNDQAQISETTEFRLDTDVPRSSLVFIPQDSTVFPGSVNAQILGEGAHTFISERMMTDAYSETIENIKAYKIGTKSKVEYDVRINPIIDLESVDLFVNALNTSQISGFEIVSATGQAIKEKRRISETEYFVKLGNLKANRTAILRVGYLLEDSQTYAGARLAELSGANLTNASRELLQHATTQYADGNYTKAIELIEKARVIEKEAVKKNAKLEKEYTDLSRTIRNERNELDFVLSNRNTSDPFMTKLLARQTELERVLTQAKTSDLNLSERVETLKKIDTNWLTKQISDMKKQAYKEYNDLKTRFFNAGNSSTPAEFLAFEAAYNKLDAVNSVDYAAELRDTLAKVKAVVETQETAVQADKGNFRIAFENLKTETNGILQKYLKESASAKGTEYSGLFTETEKTVQKTISDAEISLNKDPRILSLRMAEVTRVKAKMTGLLGNLANQSETRFAYISQLIRTGPIEQAKRTKLEERMMVVKGMMAAGEYINSLRAMTTVSKELEGNSPENNNLLLLGITAAAIIGVVVLYIIKGQKGKKEEPILRKLERTDQPETIPEKGDREM